jgi:hypothetical protein
LPDLLSDYKTPEANIGQCGGVDTLRSGVRTSVRIRRARYGGAPATPGVIIPIGESEKENKRERMWEKTE